MQITSYDILLPCFLWTEYLFHEDSPIFLKLQSIGWISNDGNRALQVMEIRESDTRNGSSTYSIWQVMSKDILKVDYTYENVFPKSIREQSNNILISSGPNN